MVTRVTNQAMQATALRNIFRITEDLFKTNTEIATGKRINRPSDDPAGIRDTLLLRTSIAQSQQFTRNINGNAQFTQNTDAAMSSVGLGLIRSRELALGALSGTDTPDTRGFAANEIGEIIAQVFLAANTQVKNQFIFSGTKFRVEPFQRDPSGSGAVYLGNSDKFRIEIAKNQTIDVTVPGSEVFGTDLNTAITLTTLLADLNGGAGLPAGTFSITDRSGNSGTVSVPAGGTVGGLITAINGAGTNVTASINSTQDGLLLTDSSTLILQSLTIVDTAGNAAQTLGIEGQRDGSFLGVDLDPQVTTATLLSDLNGGSGLTLGSISITNGAASGTVNLSSASTLGDVITLINASGLNVTASIDSVGKALRVDSTDPTTVAIVSEVGQGTTAQNLGIGGGQNIFSTLFKLKKALELDDSFGIIASLDNLNASENSINNSRAKIGAILRRMENTLSVHEKDVVDQTSQKSKVEDADMIRKASDLQQLSFALEATLNTTARILQPSLLDFLR